MQRTKPKFHQRFIIIYWILAILPVCWMVVSTYSYYSVLSTFKQTPANDTLYELARSLHLTINAVPRAYGKIILIAFFAGALFFPLFVFVNFIMTKNTTAIFFYKRQSLILLAIYTIAFVLTFYTNPFGGWYLGFVLD